MAELADAPDLGSGGEIRRGSSPLLGNMLIDSSVQTVKHNNVIPLPAVRDLAFGNLMATCSGFSWNPRKISDWI